MGNKTIEIDGMTYDFQYNDDIWSVIFPESQTKIKKMAQLNLLKVPAEHFVPVDILHEEDAYTLRYRIPKHSHRFSEISAMERLEKLRALYNIGELRQFINTRYTFFLHPDNIVFDINLVPSIVHRGVREVLPPFEMSENKFFKQYQCLIVAMFSKKYSFENLYSGSLNNARSTQFEKNIGAAETIEQLMTILKEAFIEEQKTVERTMKLLPKKKFRTFKGLAVSFMIATVLLAIPLGYFAFIKAPYQDKLLAANESFLKTDYNGVITGLEDEEPTKLPATAQYQLAYSYIQGENLGENEKENIMRNVSLKSDKQYLLYWIYNGRGDFSASLDIAKVLDDTQLIGYSLMNELKQVQNDTNLSGDEKIEKIDKIKEELEPILEELNINDNEADDKALTEQGGNAS